jgi:Flp pilus assembly pilin Flp
MFEYLRTLRDLKTDRRGVTMLEYAVMGSIIAAALVAGVPILTNAVGTGFSNVANSTTTGANAATGH